MQSRVTLTAYQGPRLAYFSLACFTEQNRYNEAKMDYIKLYMIRHVPLAIAQNGNPEQHIDLYSPTHMGATQERKSLLCVLV